ncbi:MAG TPA: HEAT repeat domain-containing protein, partial [bacterium]|nr:HEAT repeat domain-containing protein [bacterium]
MIGDIFAGGSYTDADINFQTGEIIEILAKQIETENWRLRKSIVESFKKINNPLCLPVLSKIMKYPQIDSHSTAIDALIHFGERSVPYAIPYLSDEDHDVRILSANILGFIKSPTALKDLIKKLNTETNINVKYAIIESLGNIGSDKAADSLLSILEYEDVYIKIAIIESLGKIGSIKACPLLMSYLEDEMLRGLCIDALGNIGADIAINSIIDYFGDDDEINSKIISAISNIFRKSLKSGEEKHNLDLIKGICRQFFKKPDRYERLLGVLKNRDVSLKSDALLILSWIDNLKLTRELVLLLENQEFRDRVREMLIKIGHSIKDDIVTEFKETESPVIKRIILEIIGIVGEEKEADFLITLLTENKSELILIEDQIIYALGWLRCDKAVSLILKYLENSSDILQSAAIGALSIIGNSEVRDYCRKNIKSDNIRKKTGCIKILGYIGDSANINILKEIDDFESKEVIISFIDAISYIGDKAGIDLIVRFLNEPDNEIKEHIVTALTRINDKKIIPILVNLLKDENMWIKYFALRTLGEIGDETIIGNILPLLKDPVGIIKIASLTAASKINYRLPKNTIEELFQSGDPDVKVE